jgi:hypothetical protein
MESQGLGGAGDSAGRTTLAESLDKYRDLFHLSQEAAANEIERARRLEEKAAKLITLCGVLIAFAGLIGKFVFSSLIPPRLVFDWLCIISFLVYVISIIYAFVNLLGVLNIINISVNPMNQEMITFFDKNSHINVLYALARNNVTAIALNTRQHNKKLWKLKCSYWSIHCSMAFMLIFIIAQIGIILFN